MTFNIRIWPTLSAAPHELQVRGVARTDTEVIHWVQLCETYRREEPEDGWRLEMRGTQTDWHEAQVDAFMRGVVGYCQHCGWPVAEEGWTLTGAHALPLDCASPNQCEDTSCVVKRDICQTCEGTGQIDVGSLHGYAPCPICRVGGSTLDERDAVDEMDEDDAVDDRSGWYPMTFQAAVALKNGDPLVALDHVGSLSYELMEDDGRMWIRRLE